MAKENRWARYRPPSGSGGGDSEQSSSRPAAASSSSGASKKPTSSAKKSSNSSKAEFWKRTWGGWVVLGLIVFGVIFAMVVAISDGDGVSGGGGDNPEIERKTLDVDFISDAMALSEGELGKQVVRVELSEYGIDVEYYDATTNRERVLQVDTYTDGYTLRVDNDPYIAYLPKAFSLDEIEPQALIDAVDEALDKSDGADYFRLVAEIDRDSEQLVFVVTTNGDELVEVTTGP